MGEHKSVSVTISLLVDMGSAAHEWLCFWISTLNETSGGVPCSWKLSGLKCGSPDLKLRE